MELYKTNKALKKWAEEKGYPIQGGVVTVMGETPISVCLIDGGFYQVRVNIDPTTADKETLKSMKKLVKPYGHFIDNLKERFVAVQVPGATVKSVIKKIEGLIDEFPRLLKEKGIQLSTVCVHCGQGDCDTYAFTNGLVNPAHTHCNNKRINEILEEVEENEISGNYGIALVAAIIGAIIGAIPSFITIYFFDYLIGYLFALIPLASAYAYQRAKGIKSAIMPITVSIISLLTSIILSFFCVYAIVNQELKEYFANGVPFDVFIEIMKDKEVSGSFVTFFVQVILFCLLGIYISWRYMSRTNKTRKAEIESMKNN